MNEPFPSLDLFSPDDNSTIANLISYLEEFKSKRDHLIHVRTKLKLNLYNMYVIQYYLIKGN